MFRLFRFKKFLSTIILSLVSSALFSQEVEQIQIITYYPAPYGSYRDMQVHRALVVGDMQNYGYSFSNFSQGEIWVEDSVIFREHSSLPSGGENGEILYANNQFYYFDGSQWKDFGGSQIKIASGVAEHLWILVGAYFCKWIDLSSYNFTSPPHIIVSRSDTYGSGVISYSYVSATRFRICTSDGRTVYWLAIGY